MAEVQLSLDPKMLGFWVKCVREASNWSQEAVAASARLDVRTIQRVEAGKPINLQSRRSLAQGLGYDDLDVFQSAKFIESVQEILHTIQAKNAENYYKQFPDSVRVEAFRVESASDLETILQSNAYSFNSNSKLPSEVRKIAATMFDYLQDLGDIFGDISYSDKLTFLDELQDFLNQLQRLGAISFYAKRTTSIAGSNWANKTPMRIDIAYLVVVPDKTDMREMIVSKRIAFAA
jgi:transcriptional regulator with XRE-family HTH domain